MVDDHDDDGTSTNGINWQLYMSIENDDEPSVHEVTTSTNSTEEFEDIVNNSLTVEEFEHLCTLRMTSSLFCKVQEEVKEQILDSKTM